MDPDGSQGAQPQGQATPSPEPPAAPDASQQGAETPPEATIPPEITALVNNAVNRAIEAVEQKYAPRVRELETEKARLEGQLAAGQPAQPQQQYLGSEGEYQATAASLNAQLQLAQAQGEETRAAEIAQHMQTLRSNYQGWQQHRQEREQAKIDRRIARATFMATQRIDPNTDLGRTVEALHDNGFELNDIQARILDPIKEVQRLKGEEDATAATAAAQTAATQIEPGQAHAQPPAPISRETKPPEQEEEDAIVEHYQRHTAGGAAERALLGDFG